MEIGVPRIRDASFEPRMVAKRQPRLTGVDEMVISLPAKGLTQREISAPGRDAAEVPNETIPRSPTG